MSRDPDAYLLDGVADKANGGKSWRTAWERRVHNAWANGKIDHTPDPDAPFGALAWSGYLLPLKGDVLAEYRKYQRARGLRADDPLGDSERWEFERQYIQKHRKK